MLLVNVAEQGATWRGGGQGETVSDHTHCGIAAIASTVHLSPPLLPPPLCNAGQDVPPAVVGRHGLRRRRLDPRAQ